MKQSYLFVCLLSVYLKTFLFNIFHMHEMTKVCKAWYVVSSVTVNSYECVYACYEIYV